MHFRTELHPEKRWDLPLNTVFLSMGSCFADAMGKQLHDHKFHCLANPFGTIYNPVSIQQLLMGDISSDGMMQQQELWYHYRLHSDFRATDKGELWKRISSVQQQVREHLTKTDVLLITLGTAFVYRRLDTGEVVANCHKVPQAHFSKELLTTDAIVTHFKTLYAHLKTIRPHLQVILTVSPVRHIKDTLELNSVSKAQLRIACHTLQQTCADMHYFPAYELMTDDLRDYRYYADDLLHPTPLAENYIWEKWVQSTFNEEAIAFIQQWAQLKKALHHRPFNPTSSSHQSFLKKQLTILHSFHQKVNCEQEIAWVQEQIVS